MGSRIARARRRREADLVGLAHRAGPFQTFTRPRLQWQAGGDPGARLDEREVPGGRGPLAPHDEGQGRDPHEAPLGQQGRPGAQRLQRRGRGLREQPRHAAGL